MFMRDMKKSILSILEIPKRRVRDAILALTLTLGITGVSANLNNHKRVEKNNSFSIDSIDEDNNSSKSIKDTINENNDIKISMNEIALEDEIVKEEDAISSNEIEEDVSMADSFEVEKSIDEKEQVAREVIQGKWSNGQERIELLNEAGFDYAEIQSIVNQILKGTYVRQEEPSENIQDVSFDDSLNNEDNAFNNDITPNLNPVTSPINDNFVTNPSPSDNSYDDSHDYEEEKDEEKDKHHSHKKWSDWQYYDEDQEVRKKGSKRQYREHSYSSWSYNSETGNEERVCSTCNHKQTREHVNHNYKEIGVIVKDIDDDKHEITKVYKCDDCHKEKKETEVKAHNFELLSTKYDYIDDDTHKETKVYKCNDCHHEKTVESTKSHKLSESNLKSVSKEEIDDDKHKVIKVYECGDCHQEITKVIEEAHSYSLKSTDYEYIDNDEHKETKVYKCDDCHHEKIVVENKSHDNIDASHFVNPTSKDTNTHTLTSDIPCSCGHYITKEENHYNPSDSTTIEHDPEYCTKEYYTCVCGDIIMLQDEREHDYKRIGFDPITATATYTCNRCGHTKTVSGILGTSRMMSPLTSSRSILVENVSNNGIEIPQEDENDEFVPMPHEVLPYDPEDEIIENPTEESTEEEEESIESPTDETIEENDESIESPTEESNKEVEESTENLNNDSSENDEKVEESTEEMIDESIDEEEESTEENEEDDDDVILLAIANIKKEIEELLEFRDGLENYAVASNSKSLTKNIKC